MPRKKKKSTDRINGREAGFILIALVSIIFASIVVLSEKPAEKPHAVPAMDTASIEDLSTEGFIEVEATATVIDDNGVVSLTGGCRRMTAGTDPLQAQSISDALAGEVGPRPSTHELMRDAFDNLGVDVVMVKVTELKGTNFHGKVILQKDDTLLSLDSRPSDGIALAIRTDAPIYFNETLIDEQGRRIC